MRGDARARKGSERALCVGSEAATAAAAAAQRSRAARRPFERNGRRPSHDRQPNDQPGHFRTFQGTRPAASLARIPTGRTGKGPLPSQRPLAQEQQRRPRLKHTGRANRRGGSAPARRIAPPCSIRRSCSRSPACACHSRWEAAGVSYCGRIRAATRTAARGRPAARMLWLRSVSPRAPAAWETCEAAHTGWQQRQARTRPSSWIGKNRVMYVQDDHRCPG